RVRSAQTRAQPGHFWPARPRPARALPTHRPGAVSQRADLLHARAPAACAAAVRVRSARRRLPGTRQSRAQLALARALHADRSTPEDVPPPGGTGAHSAVADPRRDADPRRGPTDRPPSTDEHGA